MFPTLSRTSYFSRTVMNKKLKILQKKIDENVVNVYFVFGMRGFGHEFTNGETNATRNIEHFFTLYKSRSTFPPMTKSLFGYKKNQISD